MDLNKIDTTDTSEVWRTTRVHPSTSKKIKSRRWLDRSGAERIPQKSIMKSNYRKQMLRYWVDLCPLRRERAERMYKYVKSPDPE